MKKLALLVLTLFVLAPLGVVFAEASGAAESAAPLFGSLLEILGGLSQGGPERIVALGLLINLGIRALYTDTGKALLDRIPEHAIVGGYNFPVRGLLPFVIGVLATLGDALVGSGGTLGTALFTGVVAGLIAKGIHVFVKADINGKPVGGTLAKLAGHAQNVAEALPEVIEAAKPVVAEVKAAAKTVKKARATKKTTTTAKKTSTKKTTTKKG